MTRSASILGGNFSQEVVDAVLSGRLGN